MHRKSFSQSKQLPYGSFFKNLFLRQRVGETGEMCFDLELTSHLLKRKKGDDA